MIRSLPALLLIAGVAHAHMVSISSGELRVDGERVYYTLRMPLYEVEQIDDPQTTLFKHFRLSSRGEEGRRTALDCQDDPARDQYVCQSEYQFSRAVEHVDVECTYYEVTIPNHVHVLHAERGDFRDQALFDFTSTEDEIDFVPPPWWRGAWRQFEAGATRAVGGLASLLFLVALVAAARGRQELYALAGMFVVGQAVIAAGAPVVGWYPAPLFVEAAAALTIAYLAVEMLVLPKAGQRWLVVGVLGGFHGLYLAMFLRETGFHAGWVLSGAMLTDLLLLAMLGAIWAFAGPRLERVHGTKVIAGGLLAFGLFWFLYRLGR